MYLHYKSCHPTACKTGIPYSQALRYRRICSEDTEFEAALETLKHRFLKRGYPKNIIETGIQKARSTTRESALKPKEITEEKEKMIPLVTEYHPSQPNLGKCIKRYWPILAVDKGTQNMHNQNRPLSSYKKPPSIKNMLVRSKFPPTDPTKRKQYTDKCNKPCPICKYMHKSNTFRSSQTHKEYNILQKSTCQTKNVIYLITCKLCNIQYVGETGNTLNERFVGHRYDIRTKAAKAVSTHFTTNNHNDLHMNIQIIQVLDDPNRKARERVETKWMELLQSYTPEGLNSNKTLGTTY